MPCTLRYTEVALADLAQIRRWLFQPGSGVAARRRLTSIVAAINQLPKYPYISPLGDVAGVRELSCPGGYIVVYEVTPMTGRSEDAEDVRIMRIFGPGQLRASNS